MDINKITFKSKKDLNTFLRQVFNEYGPETTAKLIAALQKIGFELSTMLGMTTSYKDYVIMEVKDLSDKVDPDTYDKKLEEYNKQYFDKYATFNNSSVYAMKIGAARNNIKQLAISRGYFVDVRNKVIPRPVINSLAKGINQREFSDYANAARKGILDRVMFTQKPGYFLRQAIYALNVEVDVNKICEPKDLLNVTITDKNKHKFLYRFIKQKDMDILLDEINIDKFVGKEVKMYSPIYCTLPNNKICKRCAGLIYEKLNSKQLGVLSAHAISEFAYTGLLKSMHTGARAKVIHKTAQDLINSLKKGGM